MPEESWTLKLVKNLILLYSYGTLRRLCFLHSFAFWHPGGNSEAFQVDQSQSE